MDATVDKGQLLVVSYAFPPLRVAMAPCVAKALRGLKLQGYTMDVVSADIFAPLDGYHDDSLLPYADSTVRSTMRLRPAAFGKHHLLTKLGDRMVSKCPSARVRAWRDKLWQWLNPDAMAVLHSTALPILRAKLRNGRYGALLSFAPFHSVNPVIAQLKKEFPKVKWIAQFGDPWVGNPLEHNPYARSWAEQHEPKVLQQADFIVHNSQPSLELMTQRYGETLREKSMVIYHPFDASLYPARAKAKNNKITLRYVGVLFEDRTPEPLFMGMGKLLVRQPELADRVAIELVGPIEPGMLTTDAASVLPPGMVTSVPNVSYIDSLERMYDADILVLLEADTAHNLFMPSKLSDYIGAGSPILGIVPQGPARQALADLKSLWLADPADSEAISLALEQAIDYVQENPSGAWGDTSVRDEFSVARIGTQYDAAITKVKAT